MTSVSARVRSKLGTAHKVVREATRLAWFLALERLLPLRRHQWCFCAWPNGYPHTLDNPRAVFEEVKDDPSIRKVILVRGAPAGATAAGANVHLVEAESLRGALELARSGVVLVGYSLRSLSSYGRHLTARHRIVQLWHGIPLKRIGKLFPPETWWDEETHKYAATVCSSVEDRKAMAAAFAPLPEERVWLTGLPRNATVLTPEAELPADYRAQLDDLRARLAGRRLVLYAPTWRTGGDGIYQFGPGDKAALDAVLARHGAVFGVRGHANRRTDARDASAGADGGFIYLNDFPDVNVVLRLTDVLVTDYSSIYIDFLITGRPVLHFTYDRAEYVNERGFLYDLDVALAAPGLDTAPELVAALDAALARGQADPARYATARRLFHDRGDGDGDDGRAAARAAARIRALS